MAPGPGKDMFDSTRIIAKNQYQKAKVTLLLQQVNFYLLEIFKVDVSKVVMNHCILTPVSKHKCNIDSIFGTNHLAR